MVHPGIPQTSFCAQDTSRWDAHSNNGSSEWNEHGRSGHSAAGLVAGPDHSRSNVFAAEGAGEADVIRGGPSPPRAPASSPSFAFNFPVVARARNPTWDRHQQAPAFRDEPFQ